MDPIRIKRNSKTDIINAFCKKVTLLVGCFLLMYTMSFAQERSQNRSDQLTITVNPQMDQ